VGIAKCVDLRLTKHNAGRGARYTRSRLPVRLLHSERLANHSTALRREHEVKTWTRSQKIERFGLPCAARIGAANVA
jgi:putative endonuclease